MLHCPLPSGQPMPCVLSASGRPRPCETVLQTNGCCCGPEMIGPVTGKLLERQLGVRPAVAAAVAVRGERVRAEREAVHHPGQRARVGVERQRPRDVVAR